MSTSALLDAPASADPAPADRALVTLTPEARAAAREFFEAEQVAFDVGVLRVAVMPGGCSGFRYSLTLDDAAAEDDLLVSAGTGAEAMRVAVDPFSAQYLDGTVIGYTSTLMGSGFTFTNPNATGGCGCGSSFAA